LLLKTNGCGQRTRRSGNITELEEQAAKLEAELVPVKGQLEETQSPNSNDQSVEDSKKVQSGRKLGV